MASFTMKYKNFLGITSTRKIEIREVYRAKDGKLILNAIDLKVSRFKSFKVESIISMSDEWDNPVVDKNKFFGSLIKDEFMIETISGSQKVKAKQTYKMDCLIQLDYKNEKEEVTIRTVKASKLIEADEHVYIGGICLQTNKYKTFRQDRIIQIVDATTGEIHSDPKTFLVRFKNAA